MTSIQIMRSSHLKSLLLLNCKKQTEHINFWTLNDLSQSCGLNLKSCKSFVQKLIDLGYVQQKNNYQFNYIYAIKIDKIDNIADAISRNWGTNIYRSQNAPRKICDFTTSELIHECKKRGLFK